MWKRKRKRLKNNRFHIPAYKAEKLRDTWTENDPIEAQYNRSRSRRFDHACFEDWFEKVALPFWKRKSGRCVLIGDNLSSHFFLIL